MQELMRYEEVAELLELDVRDEKRNLMLLGAVCEKICFYLERNLVINTVTEICETCELQFVPREYPVRNIIDLVDVDTGEKILLSPDTPIKDIVRPDAHTVTVYKSAGEQDRRVRLTYRYGYSLEEMPLLIKATILVMLKEAIADSVDCLKTKGETEGKNQLEQIEIYRRIRRL